MSMDNEIMSSLPLFLIILIGPHFYLYIRDKATSVHFLLRYYHHIMIIAWLVLIVVPYLIS